MHLVSCGTGRGDVTCRRGAQRSAMPLAESVVYTLVRVISTLACVLRLATRDAIARLGLSSRFRSRSIRADFAEEGAKELYLLRTHDGWTAFSHCGFVVSWGALSHMSRRTCSAHLSQPLECGSEHRARPAFSVRCAEDLALQACCSVTQTLCLARTVCDASQQNRWQSSWQAVGTPVSGTPGSCTPLLLEWAWEWR